MNTPTHTLYPPTIHIFDSSVLKSKPVVSALSYQCERYNSDYSILETQHGRQRFRED